MRVIRICLLGTVAWCGFISAATADESASSQPAAHDIVLAQVNTQPNTAGSTPGGSAIETVTVTAQRRSEDIQRVPVAITALEGSTLDTQGIVGFQSLSFRVPSLRFGAGVTGGENVITMRGLGSQNTTPGGDSPVAYSVDGVTLQRSTAIDPEFYDIDRIEVLRGPQGTLYGRNSVGGSINVITNHPQDEFGASLDFLVGDYAAHIVRGYVTGPIVDDGGVQVLGRFTGVYAQHDPYADNLSTAPTATHNQDAEDLYMLRGELQFNLSPSANLLLTASTLNSRDPVATNVAWWEVPTRYIIPGAPPQPTIPLGSRCDFSTAVKFDPRKFCHDWHESASNKLDLFTGTLNWDLGFATLTSVTGYETNHVDQSSDGDGSNLPMAAGQLWTIHQRQLSEEVRLASHESDSPLSWLGGFIYFYAANYENFIYFDTGYNDVFPIPGIFDNFHFHNGGNSITKAWAPFGQVDFDFGKTSAAFPLTLSLGLRYSHDERASAGFLDYALPSLGLDFPQTFGFDKTWSQWTGNLTARYQFTPDVMAYATVARGYLSGGGIIGLGSVVPGVGQQYNPEHVWSYELGLKSQWMENRLQLNVAAFHEDIVNMQVFVQSGVNSGVENAAKSRVNGVELEGVAIPVDNLRLNATVTLTDAKYLEYISRDTRYSIFSSPCFNGDFVHPEALCNFKGNKLNQTPPYTVDVGAEYTFITPMGSFTPRAEVFFSGEVYFTPPNNPLARQSPYHQTDLRLTWNSVDNRWWADAFVKNLENKDILSNDGLQSISLGMQVQEPDNYAYYPPRTFGLRVGVHL